MFTKEELAKLYGLGYRYCIEFDPASKLEPLTAKTISNVCKLIREDYPKEKNWRAWRFDSAGQKIDMNLAPPDHSYSY